MSAGQAWNPLARWGRVALVHAGMLLVAAALVARAALVQLGDTAFWRARARAQQLAPTPLPARRGPILDEGGRVLVETRELVRLSIAPREVAADVRRRGDGALRRAALARALTRAGVAAEWVSRAIDTARAWTVLPGRFLASEMADVTQLRGVHAEVALERVPAPTPSLRGLIGRADDDGLAVDGLEKALDAVLRGERGSTVLLRDARGARFTSPDASTTPPTPGGTVLLTINQPLQDIAERALGDAVARTGASGGDIVILDPASGAVRALASRRLGLPSAAPALTEPYEPGSTLKPFFAARLIELGRAEADEVVNTHGGTWVLNGRRIVDDHPAPSLTLAEVIRHSSNIGIVQFAQRLTPVEEFELLRDLGFGVPTGLPFPAEEGGSLPRPAHWDGLTAASLAMGYAVSVTPLQLAVAYGAIANGGELLEPALVQEVRTPAGEVRFRHARRVVRRVMQPETARSLLEMMRGVVETGTAAGSGLAAYDVAGKTGTARRVERGRYVRGEYTVSFVGLFPAETPQLVVLVKLDRPARDKYGGRAAAPVTRAVLQAAIAARAAALDRGVLRAAAAAHAGALGSTLVSDTGAVSTVPEAAASGGTYVWRLDMPHAPATRLVAAQVIPDVRGLSARRAANVLHRAGFRVSLGGKTSADGGVIGTVPAAGSSAGAGTTVHLVRAP